MNQPQFPANKSNHSPLSTRRGGQGGERLRGGRRGEAVCILFINTSSQAGGAAIAAQRLMHALRREGVDVQMLVRQGAAGDDPRDIIHAPRPRWNHFKFALERLEIFLRNGLSRKGLFAVDAARLGVSGLETLPAFQQADVIHLHWTNQAMLSLSDLRAILRSGKRVVWTMHDMWPFTGICHYANECTRWQTGCGACPQLRRPGAGDLSATTYRRKRAVYAQGPITFVAPSRWLAQLAQQSPLLAGHRVTDIPNPIDTALYCPAGTEGVPPKEALRQSLGLPRDKRLVLFTAFNATDPRKGIDHLIEAARILAQSHPDDASQMAFVIAGKNADLLAEALPLPAYPMGYVADAERMRSLYRAADVLAVPTLHDNLPNTIMEAQACGTPVVAFGVGGVPQMVETGVNGYLAAPRDSADFAQGLLRTLRPDTHPALCRNARARVLAAYGEGVVARRYIELYK